MKLAKRAPIAAVAVALLAGCGGGDGTIAADKVDREAWKAELTSLDNVGTDPDFDTLDRLTRDDCKAKVDSLALRFTLEGARPDITRVNMKYVCPDEAKKVDEALQQVADLG